MHTDTKLRAKSAPWHNGIELLAIQPGPPPIGGLSLGVIHFAPHPDAIAHKPTLTLDIDQAQVLMDDLWNCGLRPTEGAGTAGAMAATVRHLEDMRALVNQLTKGGLKRS